MNIIKYKKSIIIAICTLFLIIVFIVLANDFFSKYFLSFQFPITTRTPVLISPQVSFVSPIDEAWALEGGEGAVLPLREPITDIEKEIYMVFGEDWEKALRIFECESGLNPKAINTSNKNGTFDAGLPQINSVHGIDKKWLFNYKIAIRVAKQMFDKQGWSPWYSSFACHKIK